MAAKLIAKVFVDSFNFAPTCKLYMLDTQKLSLFPFITVGFELPVNMQICCIKLQTPKEQWSMLNANWLQSLHEFDFLLREVLLSNPSQNFLLNVVV